MKTLLTGGAGFVGSHLAEALLKEGHSVQVIDDLSTGSMGNIAHLKGHALGDTQGIRRPRREAAGGAPR